MKKLNHTLIKNIQAKVNIKQGQLFINGKWVNSTDGGTFDAINPVNEEMIATFAKATAPDVDKAVGAARQACDAQSWTNIAPKDREIILNRVSDLILENREELAYLESLDVGKPFLNAYNGDIPGSARNFKYFAGWITKLYGETSPVDPNYFNYVLREPLGVVGVITPWNFPLAIAAKKIALSLATGNCVVFKPAEQTSLTALKLADFMQESGVPDGVFNVITGIGEEAGDALVKHKDVNMISFTGEAQTGQLIQKNAAQTLKKCVFELGGKSPNIVFDDADIEDAVSWSYAAAFANQGENCNAGTRLFLHKDIKEIFLQKLLEKIKEDTCIGDPLHEDTTMGPLVSKEQFNKVLNYIEIGKQEGATVLCGGDVVTIGDGKGYFVAPTVFDGVTNNMRIAQEEIFGPVLSVLEFDNVQQVLKEANDIPYGLAAVVHTKDLVKAHYMAKKLDAGTVWINCHAVVDPNSPYGGRKMSGLGTEGGVEGILEHTQAKSVWVNMNSAKQFET